MFAWLRRRPVTVPPDAEPALAAGRVFVWKGLVIVVGPVLCDELRVGDEVVLVGAVPAWRGRIAGLEEFQKTLATACRGTEVGVLHNSVGRVALPPTVTVYRVRPGTA